MNRKVIVVLLLSLLFGWVQAAELAGVKLDDRIQLKGDTTPLLLNGLGIREKFFFNIYVAGLYLPSKSKSSAEILAMAGSKRIAMHFLYKEVGKDKLVEGWNEGFEYNQSAARLDQLKDRLKTFNTMFETVHKGDVILLDFVPGSGTRVILNGVEKGRVGGDDFNQALLAVWLGKKPADKDLKEGMLGL